MKISVIIPVYNRAGFFTEAVWSVLLQKRPADEIIVVDDGSTDLTPLYAEIFGNAIRYIRIEHSGVSRARNVGVEASTCEWIAFLDSDDLFLPRKLLVQERFHTRNPEFLISQTDEIWMRRGVRVNPMKKHLKYGDDFLERSLERCLISPSCVMIHRKVFDKVGLFDESLPACEDYDMWLRVLPHFKVGYIPEKLVVKRGGHPDQLSRQFEAVDRFRVYALEKAYRCAAQEKWREMIREAALKKLRILLNGALKRGKYEDARAYAEKIKFFGGGIPDNEVLHAPKR